MSASVWVYLSTIIFLAFVFLKSYRLIIKSFENKQKEIRDKLKSAEEVYIQAQDLYEEYREKLETLELEAEQILKDADNVSKQIIAGTEASVEKMIRKKRVEVETRAKEYEEVLKNRLVGKYADILIDKINADDTVAKGFQVSEKDLTSIRVI